MQYLLFDVSFMMHFMDASYKGDRADTTFKSLLNTHSNYIHKLLLLRMLGISTSSVNDLLNLWNYTPCNIKEITLLSKSSRTSIYKMNVVLFTNHNGFRQN